MLRDDISITITLVLVLINAGVSFAAFNNQALMDKLKFNPYLIKHRKQWWRFFTHGFVHADIMHLAFNMIAFYSFGRIMEQLYHQLFGEKAILYFLCLYFGGLLTAIIPTYEKHKNDSWYNSVGASGAVSSVIFAFIVYAPFSTIAVFFVPMPAIVFSVLYVAYSIYAGRRGADNVNHSAHLSGALFGLLFTAIVDPQAYPHFIEIIKNRLG